MRAICALLAAAILVSAAPPMAKPSAKRIRVPLSWSNEGNDAALKGGDVKVAIDDGAAARVVRLRSPKDDLLVLVVLDLVGDIALVGPARSGLIEQIRSLPKNAWVGLLRAQDGLHVMLDPTPDRDKAANAIMAMPVAGKAGLLDSIETATRLADAIAAKSAVRVAVLYITDSDVRNYREDFANPVINSSDSRDLSRRFPEGLIREKISKLTDSLSARQTPVFITHLAYSRERLDEAYQRGLMQLATATGGQAFLARSQSEIPGLVAQSIAAVQSQYSVVVQLPEKAPKVVNVSVQSGDRALSYRSRFVLR